ncbi:hypothetical protein [Thalassotalea mangrovi]|uniref:Haem-binding uptake Tiki superfamily ChaN domain-containing protein n=1 Tax=Thalassotalea mangrovi TaxID=2572245 RepID=A0A4U1B607_9GAMM|nr:hypothetical protein [Thalassotalea mangrovi]TKB45838.1 hypothetical protein E8M12_06215 [Thalassotalea mangrovi]
MRTLKILVCSTLFWFLYSNFSLAAEDSLSKAITQSAQPLHFNNGNFSGPAFDTLVEQGKQAQFFLIGEEHGIAENPMLAAQLFAALKGSGYQHLVIEVSPQIAKMMEQHLAKDGLEGLRQLFAKPGGEPAFFGMQQEAKMLADIKALLPDNNDVLLGVDYEVASDRPLLQWLQEQEVLDSAKAPLTQLTHASQQSWDRYYQEKNPQYIFSFAGDPALVKDVIESWPSASNDVDWTLHELQKTLEINRYWVQGQGWQSNQARVELLRENFLKHWQQIKDQAGQAKLMAKLGASHLMRGLSSNATFDLGTLLPELAEINGGKAVSVMVLPGAKSNVAVLDPVNWAFQPAPAKDGYTKGLQALYAQSKDGMMLFDMKKLRPMMKGKLKTESLELYRAVFGFDYVLIMTGSTASAEFEHQ